MYDQLFCQTSLPTFTFFSHHLYSNVSWFYLQVTDEQLMAAFPAAYHAQSAVIRRKPNGRSMGFGFVSFANIADAKKVPRTCTIAILCDIHSAFL
jgi:RNA recognition motif-containing protein